ncbi:MAG: hypothetical protein GX220_05350 [Treponema sp.]|nr:hypothetical protein [Treponema sp.]
MNKKVLCIICLLLYILSFFLLSIFRINENILVWKNSRLLIIPIEYDNEQISHLLSENGIKYISSSTQFLNFPYDTKITNTYKKNLLNYFFNKEKTHQIIYLKNASEKDVKNISKIFTKLNIPFSTDAKNRLPYFPSLLTLIFFIILFFMSKKKTDFTFKMLPFLFFSFACPLWLQNISCCLFIFTYYLIQPLMGRYGLQKFIKSHFLFYLVSFSFILINLLSGIKIFFLMILTLISFFSISYFSKNIHIFKNAKKHIFEPVMIVGANQIKIIEKKTIVIFIIYFCIFFILINFSGTSKINFTIPVPKKNYLIKKINVKNFEKISVKKQQDKNIKPLPDLFDFIYASWNSNAFMFQNLNDKNNIQNVVNFPKENDIICFPEYKFVSGSFEKSIKKLYVFDDNFINETFKKVDNSFSIESLLISQNNFCLIEYANKAKGINSNFTNAKLIFMLCISLIFLINIMILWRKNDSKR